MQKRPGLYFRNLNLFTLRQWISRVHTTYLSQTVICILLLLAIGITACSVGLNTVIEGATSRSCPYDIILQNRGADEFGPVDMEKTLADAGFDQEKNLSWSLDMTVWYNDEKVTGLPAGSFSGILSLSEYNALLNRKNLKPYDGPLPQALEEIDRPSVEGPLGLTLAVVSDDVAEQLSIRRQVWYADYRGSAQEAEEIEAQIRAAVPHGVFHGTSRLDAYREEMGNKMMVLFLGLYLGFTFLLAAAAVLALQQLSQAADNMVRYRVLRRLGTDEKMMARSATQQVVLAFLLPLGLALIHAFVGMKAANDVIAMAGRLNAVESSAVTALVLVVIYGGYFLATSAACRRMARSA